MCDSALREGGGRGRALEALEVEVEKVEAAEGEVGDIVVGVAVIFAVPGVEGMGSGMRSACGTGRRRLRMDVAVAAAEMGSVTTLWRGGVIMGRGGTWGGEGGGECWYVVELL